MSQTFEEALEEAERITGLSLDDLGQIGLRRVVAEVRAFGGVIVRSDDGGEPMVVFDLWPVLEKLSATERETIYDAASEAGVSVGELVRGWIADAVAAVGKEAA